MEGGIEGRRKGGGTQEERKNKQMEGSAGEREEGKEKGRGRKMGRGGRGSEGGRIR